MYRCKHLLNQIDLFYLVSIVFHFSFRLFIVDISYFAQFRHLQSTVLIIPFLFFLILKIQVFFYNLKPKKFSKESFIYLFISKFKDL
jgi:hypothetical protein